MLVPRLEDTDTWMRKGGKCQTSNHPFTNQDLLQNSWGLSLKNNDDHDDKTIGSDSVAVVKLTLQEAMITLGEKNERHQIGNHWVANCLPQILHRCLCIQSHSSLRSDGDDDKNVNTEWLIISELTPQGTTMERRDCAEDLKHIWRYQYEAQLNWWVDVSDFAIQTLHLPCCRGQNRQMSRDDYTAVVGIFIGEVKIWQPRSGELPYKERTWP